MMINKEDDYLEYDFINEMVLLHHDMVGVENL